MQTNLFVLLSVIIGVVSCAPRDASLPTLAQPKYFDNDTVEWFPAINGGVPVHLDQMNGVVSIQNRYGFHLCSGTLVSYKLVLTAANCLLNQDGDLLDTSEIRVIADDILIIGDGSVTRQVQEIKTYTIGVTSHGIALIELLNAFIETPTLTFNEVSNYTVGDDQICQVVGWGASSLNSQVLLQTVDVKIISNAVANSSKYYNNKMPSGTIAAVSLEKNPSCIGDLGSALICDGFINGFLSFGYGCSRSDFPIIFYDTYDDDLIVSNRARMLSKPGVSKPSVSKPGSTKPGVTYPIYGGGTTNSNGKPQNCVTYENGTRVCNGAGTIKLSAAIMLFTILPYVFNTFINRF